jgi:hypothetical protein
MAKSLKKSFTQVFIISKENGQNPETQGQTSKNNLYLSTSVEQFIPFSHKTNYVIGEINSHLHVYTECCICRAYLKGVKYSDDQFTHT